MTFYLNFEANMSVTGCHIAKSAMKQCRKWRESLNCTDFPLIIQWYFSNESIPLIHSLFKILLFSPTMGLIPLPPGEHYLTSTSFLSYQLCLHSLSELTSKSTPHRILNIIRKGSFGVLLRKVTRNDVLCFKRPLQLRKD